MKKIVSRIGQKISNPIPGANNNPKIGTNSSEALCVKTDPKIEISTGKDISLFLDKGSVIKNGVIFDMKNENNKGIE